MIVTVTISTAIIVNGFTLDGVAGVQSVTSGSLRARADRDVTSRHTRGIRTTLATRTRIFAGKINARTTIGAFVVGEAFPALATRQCVADVTSGTCTHWPLFASVIVARCADRIATAGIRLA